MTRPIVAGAGVSGYIGNSTRSEIEYAKLLGKSVRYLEPPEAGT